MASKDRPDPDSGPGSRKVRIHVDGEAHLVPAGATVLDALILAGHRYLRGCGCRKGDCGECTVRVWSPDGDGPVSELACQMEVRPELRLSQLPFQWNRAFRNRLKSAR